MEDLLEKIGLGKNEARVYSALLGMESGNVASIVEKSGVPRTNAHGALKRLIGKGLVKKSGELYAAENPGQLMGMVRQQEKELKAIMPELQLGRKLAEHRGFVHVYEGLTAVKAILDSFLSKRSEILVAGIPEIAISLMESFIIDFHKRRIEAGVSMRHIYNADAQQRISYLNSLSYTEASYLPEQYNSLMSINICGDEMAMILWLNPVIVVHIEKEETAETYRKYFELLWGVARK